MIRRRGKPHIFLQNSWWCVEFLEQGCYEPSWNVTPSVFWKAAVDFVNYLNYESGR